MVEALVHPVGDRAIVEQGGEHVVHRLQHVRFAMDVQEGLLLASKGCLGQVLGRG